MPPDRNEPRDQPPEQPAGAAAVAALLDAAACGDAGAARRIEAAEPELAGASIHAAAILGREGAVRRLLAENPARVHERAGPQSAEPLLALCFSPFHGESADRDGGLLACARALLEAGADPNAHTTFREGGKAFGIPALYGVTGMHDAPRIARVLLEAGARPNDGESLFHAAQHFHRECLETLLEFGADPNETGEWGNTPLHFLLNHFDEDADRVRDGIVWLLAHGADPDVPSGRGRETALHAAVRRGRSTAVIRLLIDHGADVSAPRADGRTPWRLARQHGRADVVELLERAGAAPERVAPLDELLAACGNGDVEGARALASPELVAALEDEDRMRLPHAAGEGKLDVVRACLAAGFPVDQETEYGGTALHHACIHGRADIVRAILPYGPDLALRDREHDSTPLGWAAFGADFFRDPAGDHAGCVRALLDAGAVPRTTEHAPRDPEIARLLGSAAPPAAP